MNYYLVLLLLLIVIIILYIIKYNHKHAFYKLLNIFLVPLYRYESKYFNENYEEICKPYYKGNIGVTNNRININRNSKNEYSLLDSSITNGLIEDLKETHTVNDAMKKIVEKTLKYIHIDGQPVNYDDLLFVDVLNVPGNYFPFFHTDIEWNTFCDNNGFQMWILLEEDKDIAPRGNMFIMETDIVEPGIAIKIYKDKVLKTYNGGIFDNIIEEYNSLNDINPKIKYLNAKVGEVFIMNQNVIHCSDPIINNSKRRAINLRIVHKNKKNVKVCDLNNNYSLLLRSKYNINCLNGTCLLDDSNKLTEV